MKNPNLRENPWICDDCVSQVQSKLSFDKLLTVIDFYYPPEESKFKIYHNKTPERSST